MEWERRSCFHAGSPHGRCVAILNPSAVLWFSNHDFSTCISFFVFKTSVNTLHLIRITHSPICLIIFGVCLGFFSNPGQRKACSSRTRGTKWQVTPRIWMSVCASCFFGSLTPDVVSSLALPQHKQTQSQISAEALNRKYLFEISQ